MIGVQEPLELKAGIISDSEDAVTVGRKRKDRESFKRDEFELYLLPLSVAVRGKSFRNGPPGAVAKEGSKYGKN